MPLPFFVAYERHTPELHAIVESAFKVLEGLGSVSIPRRHFTAAWGQGPWGSMAWYVAQARDARRNQAATGVLWELFSREPWQQTKPHYELGILDTDLWIGTSDNNFVYGETRMKVNHDLKVLPDTSAGRRYVTGLIQSTARMKRYGRDWPHAFFGIVLHELGHFYGLAHTGNPNFLTRDDPRCRGSLDAGHCNARDCIMEQVNIPGRLDLLDKVDMVARNNPNYFCRDDLKALRAVLRHMYG